MKNEREKEITKNLLRNRFDIYLQLGSTTDALRIIDMAWQMDLKRLAAEMVIKMEAIEK